MTNINKKNVLVSLISIIWCIVSIWAISFLTIFQAKANDNDIPNQQFVSVLNYSWIDNNAWVLKNLNFTKTWAINDIINSFYMINNNIIIKELDVMVPGMTVPSTLDYNNSGNAILWWIGNKTTSPNTTIIWWSFISSSWNNTTFWGKEIRNEWEGTSIWWNNNTIIWNNIAVWWENNVIWWENNIIVWWSYNTISWNNIIAAWENININDNNSDNSFIFNNETAGFTPTTWNTFYINSQWGLWINWETQNNNTIVIHWWLSIWETDLDNWCSNPNNIGLMWRANDCLLACTDFSLLQSNARSLMEKSQRCVEWCEDTPKCVNPPVVPEVEHDIFSGYCTWNIFPHSIECFHNFNPDIYQDVVFTYNYVNECPEDPNKLDNPCTRKCPEWYSFGDWTCKENCVITWNNGEEITLHHWESINLYLEDNPYCNHHCVSETRTCDNWRLSSSNPQYTHLSCQIRVKPENQCNEEEYNIEENEKTAEWIYEACTWYTINWNSCTAHVKYKINACETGYTLTTWWVCQKDCIFNWIPVEYWRTITWYQYSSSNCKDQNWFSCNSYKILTCGEWWSFWPNAQIYQYTWCKLIWESCTGYNLTWSCPSNWICNSCTWYTLNNNSCNQFIKYKLIGCATWYTKDGDTCKSDCKTRRWETVKHGFPVAWYKNSSQYCPIGCEDPSNKRIMVCNNGYLEWSWTYIYSWCTTKVLTWEGYGRTTKVSNAVCEPLTWYSIQNNSCIEWSTKYKCSACEIWYTRNGQDWNWNNVKCLEDCSFTALPGNNTVYVNWSWWTITTYSTWYIECPDLASNYSQIRVCNNGYLNGSFIYTPITQTWHTCPIQNSNKVKTLNKRFNLREQSEKNLQSIGLSCSASTFNGNSCSEIITYYTYKCNSGYTRNNNTSDYKCIKCEWSIPQNAHANNNPDTPNGNNSITYYYSESNAACSFSCDNWFTRNSESNQCVSNDKKCRLANGNEYPELTYQYIYKENERICSNTCNKIHVQCINGSRRDYTTDTIITWENIYSSCSLKTGHVQSNWEPKVWLCTASNRIKLFTWNNPPEWNVILQWLCTNYTPNGETCKKWTEYKAYYCANGRSWNTCPSSCKRRNSTIESWEKLILYDRVWEFQCPDSWNSQTIECKNWVRYSWTTVKDFNDGFNYIYGEYTLVWTHCSASWFNLLNKPSTWYYETCQEYSVTTNKTCKHEPLLYKVTSCPAWFTKVWNDCKPDCTLSGYWTTTIKVHYWQSITWYMSGVLNCPGSCSSKTITCWENWQFNDTRYKYSYCFPAGNVCSTSEYPYENPNDVPGNSNIEVCTWNIMGTHSCTQKLRYRPGTGCQPWYTYSGGCKKDCSINWQMVTHYWDRITTYIPTNCPWPCHTWQLICKDNWNFEWTRWTFSCQLLGKTCSSDYNRSYCPNKWICETCTWYTLSNNQCSSPKINYKRIWCETGYVMDTYRCAKNCSDPVFGELEHGDEVTGRKIENWQCLSATRTCNNGTLDNSGYNLKNCTWCQTPRLQRVAPWQTVTWYQQGTCRSSNSSCNSTGRKCTDWKRYLNNTVRNFPSDYNKDHCEMTAGESNWCTSEHNVSPSNKIVGWKYATWCTRYEYNWSSCVWNEYLKFIWCESNYKEIDKQCFSWCIAFNKFYEHWSIATWYITPVMCTSTSTECGYETRTCDNWRRKKSDWSTGDFSWLSSTCTKQANTCEGYTLSTQPSHEHCHYDACTLYEAWTCNESNNKKYGLTSVDEWYFGNGDSCTSICGDGISTACNRPYIATWASRRLSNNILVYTRWHDYICTKQYNTVLWEETHQCSCGEDGWRNGEICKETPHYTLCWNTKDKCINSHWIEWNITNDWRWYTRKCWVEGLTETCIICNTGYTGANCDKICEWTKPQGSWIVTSPQDTVSYYNGSPVGHLSWTYEQNPNTATSISCSWSCQDWYVKDPNWDSCVKLCGQPCQWTKPTWQWVVLWSSTVACNNWWIQWYTWWRYIDNPNSIGGVCCSRSCEDGYTRNGNTCVKTSPCWDSDDYGKSPWLHEDKLCADGWSVVTQSTSNASAPTISWNLDGNLCKPIFTRYCKKDSTTKKCTEESLNTAYIKVGFENTYSSYPYMYLDWIYNENYIKISDADDITAKMGYYHKITDGPYTCAITPSDELFYDGLSTTHIPTEPFNHDPKYPDDNSVGWKIHNFNYTPSIYTINNVSYILSTIRWEEGEFKDYRCHSRNWDLRIFSCPDMIIYP